MNPWLDIDISDYVNHMSSPEVRQYQLINASFKTMLEKYNPHRIFVPGCTIGNGFEHIRWDKVDKVTALDINPEFLRLLKNKFPGENKLEVINEDFNNFTTSERMFDLIFAALFYEYVEIKPALEKFRHMMHNSSALFSLIQLPGEGQSKVSRTEYTSLEKLSSSITLTTAEEFEKELNDAGLDIRHKEQKILHNRKSFLLTESVLK